MLYIFDTETKEYIEAEIILMSKRQIQLNSKGWTFNWDMLIEEKDTRTYVLRRLKALNEIEGAIHLKVSSNMLIMDVIELAPHNIGKNKRYDNIAGCLIAFAFRESTELDGPYKGFLTFTSKTKLIKLYQKKYGAQVATGHRMFIEWDDGNKLIEKYLEFKIKD